jgi:hypothetical protein
LSSSPSGVSMFANGYVLSTVTFKSEQLVK